MKIFMPLITVLFAALVATPCFAQSPASSPAAATGPMTSPAGQPNPQEMMKQMMELSKLNENHKLLTDLDGNWIYTINDSNYIRNPLVIFLFSKNIKRVLLNLFFNPAN